MIRMDSPKEERLRQKAAAWESFLHTGAIAPGWLDPVMPNPGASAPTAA
jgi:hypothetical protein